MKNMTVHVIELKSVSQYIHLAVWPGVGGECGRNSVFWLVLTTGQSGVSIFWLRSCVLQHSMDESPNWRLMCDSSDCQSCRDFNFFSSRTLSFLLLSLYSWCQCNSGEEKKHTSWNIFSSSRCTPSPPKCEVPKANFLVCLRSCIFYWLRCNYAAS